MAAAAVSVEAQAGLEVGAELGLGAGLEAGAELETGAGAELDAEERRNEDQKMPEYESGARFALGAFQVVLG